MSIMSAFSMTSRMTDEFNAKARTSSVKNTNERTFCDGTPFHVPNDTRSLLIPSVDGDVVRAGGHGFQS
jgi:hypothetical protein